MKSDDDLAAVFKDTGIDVNKPVLNTCGSGVTASVVSLGLSVLGNNQQRLYDGSWSEYGQFEEPDFSK